MLVLAAAVYATVVDHAREGASEEVCGVLAGERDADDVAYATAAHRAQNAARTPRVAYEIAPEELLSLLDAVERAGREVVGFYHSHPRGPTGPSATDEGQATWADHHYLVVSLAGPTPALDAWRWTGERFAPDAVAVRD